MTIIEFYSAVSDLLEMYRMGMTEQHALRRLRSLNAEAAESGIDARVSEEILRRVHIFDEENSYDEDRESTYGESSYGGDEES